MIKQTKKVKMYYDEVVRLHQLGYSKSRICSILPLSYPIIKKWISIFVELSNLNSELMTKKPTNQRGKTSTNKEVYYSINSSGVVFYLNFSINFIKECFCGFNVLFKYSLKEAKYREVAVIVLDVGFLFIAV